MFERRFRLAWCLGLLTAIIAPLCAPTASAQTPTVTLSVPANTKFAEGEGNTTVTVTATLSAAQSGLTVIDLSLGGTARSTDYAVVGTLPDITIAASDMTGTADVTLRPVDDNFFEGEETVSIGGAATGVTVNAVDVALEDNEDAPTLDVSLARTDSPYTHIEEGDTASFQITVTLVGAQSEVNETVSLSPESADGSGFTSADINYGTNAPPWSLEILAGKASAVTTVNFTVVDDEIEEDGENADLRASVTIAGTTITSLQRPGQSFISIAQSDLPLLLRVDCTPVDAYAGDSISCWPLVFRGSTARTYTIEMSWQDQEGNATTLVTPASKTFTVGAGRSGKLNNLAASFTLDAGAVGMTLNASLTLSPDDMNEEFETSIRDIRVYPAADASYTMTDLNISGSKGAKRTGFRGFQAYIGPKAPRPVEPHGTVKRLEVVLDSGVVSVPCEGQRHTKLILCVYTVQQGDFDFDGQIEVPAGAVKFTRWRDMRDTTVTGPVANPLPATKTTFDTTGTLIYGGSAAIDLSVSPQTVQEGTGEQMLRINALNRVGMVDADLVIPLTFTDISTSAGDYSVRGPLSVTIPAGEVEGSTTAVLFTPTDDLRKEGRVETVRIEGSKGAAMTPFVRGANLNILDAAGITLSVSQAQIAETAGATQVTVTAEWGDEGDSALARDVEIALAWGGTAGSGDYTRSGGASVTIPANARSGTTTVTITPTDDKLLEGEETITVEGSAPGRVVTATELTLTDDEMTPAVTLSVDTDAVSESHGAAVTVTVSAELDPTVAMANDVTTVTLDLGGTATAGTDYSATWSPASRQITIPQGSTTGSNTVTLSLTPTDDSVTEGDETIIVQGTAVTDMASRNLVVKVASIALQDDDTQGINLSPRTLTVAEGATGTYEVWLGTQPTGDVTVTLSSTDATTATVDQAELTFTASTWDTRQEITVTGKDDDRNNADDRRTAEISHTVSGGGYDGVAAVVLPVTVTDDDEAASFSIADASAAEGQVVSFTVTRNGATGDAATVSWNTADDSDGDHPASSADYTAQTTAQTLSFAAGDTSKMVTVQTTQDTLDEDDETFLVELSSPSAGTSIKDATAVGTITDDDATPELSITAPAAVPEGADGATATMSFTVNLSASSERQVTVDYADAGTGTAADGTDYSSLTAGTLTFEPGDTSKTVAVTVNGDDVDEDNETVILRLSSPVNAQFADGAMTLDATGEITDDDTRGITVSAATDGVTVAEADDSGTPSATENVATYTVALDSEPTGTVTINVASGATGVATVSPISLTFTASDWGAKTLTVTGQPDDVDNDDDRRTTTITHTVAAGGTDYEDETAASVSVTVTDDEATPTVTLSLSPARIDESGNGNVSTVTAMLNHASHAQVTLTVSVPNGAPVTLSSNTTLTIAAGATDSTGTVTLTATDNNVDAPNASVAVSGTVSGGGVSNPADVTLTITDDDAAPTALTLTVDADTGTANVQNSLAEDGGAKTVRVTATLGGSTTFAEARTVTVEVGKAGDSATEGTDYQNVGTQSITLAAGASSGHVDFTLTPTQDARAEGDEKITLDGTLSGVTVTDVEITLTDDDMVGITVSAASSGVTVAEADNPQTMSTMENVTTYTMVLDSEPTGTVTISLASGDTDVATVSPSSLEFTTSDWGAKTVTVTGVSDDMDNANDRRTTTITHTVDADGTDYADEMAASVAVTVTDDEATPTVTLALNPTSIAESGNGNVSTVTAMLDHASHAQVTVSVSVPNGAPVTLSSNTTLTIAAGATDSAGTVTLTAVDNDVDAANATVAVSGTALGGGVSNPANVTLTITDDDMVGITVSAATDGVTVAEADDSGTPSATENVATYTVALDSEPTGTVTINLASGATGVATVSPISLTFTASDWGAKTVTITGQPDDVDNDDDRRTTTITHTVAAGGTDYEDETAASVSVTVTDDEATPTVTLSLSPARIDESGNGNVSTVTAMLNHASHAQVTLTVSVPNGAPVTLSSNTTLTIAAGATDSTGTVTLTATDNNVDAPNASVAVSGTVSGGGVSNPANVTLTITDDEATPTVTLALDPASIDESGDDNASTVTASLSHASHQAVTVTVSAAPGTDTASGDFTVSANKTLTIAAGATDSTGTVTITAVDNNVDAPNKSVTVSGAAAGGGVSNPADVSLTIADDEGVPTVTLVLTPPTIAESGNGNASTVTARLSGVSSTAVTVTVAAAAGAGTASGDFNVSSNKTLSIAAGATESTGTVTITAVDNDVDGPNKSVTVSGTASGGGVANPSSQTLTITDDDTRGITVTPLTRTLDEVDNTATDAITENQATYTVVLDSQPTGTVTVNLASKDGTVATVGTASLAFTTSDWNTVRTVTITAVPDIIDNTGNRRTVNIEHTVAAAGTDYEDETADSVAVTVTDDDAAPGGITLSVSPASVGEGAGETAVTVTATVGGDSRYEAATTVAVSVGGGTADSGEDYGAVAGFNIVIDAGAASGTGTFDLTPTQDALAEGSETIEVTGVAGALDVTAAEITLNDDDAAPTALTLTVDADTATNNVQGSIAEGGGAKTVRVTATLGGSTTFAEARTVTVEVGKAGDSATEGTDYTNVGTQNITIAAESSSGHVDFTLTPTQDTIHEGDETISMEGTLSGVTVTGASITLTDDETTPTVTLALDPASIDESGDDNASTVTASLSHASHQAVTVTVSAAPGTDTASGDFTVSANKTLTIAAGATDSTGTVTITAVDNNVDAPNKSVTLSGAAAGGGVSNPAAVTLTIADDEGVPTVTLVLTPPTIAESGNGNASTVTARLSGVSSTAVTVTVAAAAGAGTASGDFNVSSNKTLTIAAGATSSTGTVTITAVDNSVVDPGKTVTVSGTASGGGVSNPAAVTLTITDDDAAPTALTLTVDADTATNNVQNSLAEDGGAKTVRVTATLGGSTTFAEARTVTVEVGKAGDSATEGTDYQNVGTQSITLAAGASSGHVDFTLTPTQDTIHEGDETISMEGTLSGVTVTGASITLTDDEAPPTVTLVLTPASIDESGDDNASTVTASPSHASHQAVTVTVSAAPGTDTASGDFTVSANKTLTIAAGATDSTGTVTITAVDNNVIDPGKTVTVSGTATGGGGVNNPADQTLTITDDDSAPSGITLSVSPASVAEAAGATTVTVTATVNGTTRYATAQTVAVSVGGGTATPGTDYTAVSNFNITIAAGIASQTGTFSLTPTDDALVEGNETIDVTGTSGTLSITKATVTITDDDTTPPPPPPPPPPPLPEIEISSVTVNEGGTATFTVSLSAVSDQEVTVTVTTADGSAVSPGDYTHKSGTVRIPAGELSATFDVHTVNDNVREGDESFGVELSAPAGATIRTGVGNGRIRDDDAQPEPMELQVSVAQAREGEPMTFDVYIVPAARTAFTLNYFTRDYSAEAGLDYTPIESGSMTIVGGVSARQITVQTLDDLLVEPNERFRLELWVSGNRDVAAVTTTGTIIDDDEYPVINIGDTVAAEGETLRFPVSLSAVPAESLSVVWTVTPGSATPDADYVALNGVLDIPAGQQSGMIEVAGLQDLVDEPGETLTVTLSAPQRVLLGETVTGVGTIEDDDEAPVLSIANATVQEGEPLRFPVTLSGVSAYPISVDWAVAPGTAAVGHDYEAAAGTLDIPAGEDSGVITVVTLQDQLDEVDETLTVTLSAPQQAGLGETATALGTIQDDDEASVLRVADEAGGVVVAEEGQALVFELILSAPSARAISVDWAVTPGTATPGGDYLAASGVITLAPGETAARVEVATLDDNVLEEAQETVLLTLSNPVNVTVDGNTTGYIADNDAETVQRLEETGKAILPQVTAALTRARIEQVTECLGGDSPARSAEATLGSLLQRLPASSAELRDDERSLWGRLGGTRFKTRLKSDEEAEQAEDPDSGYDITVCGGLDWRHLGDARRGLNWDGELYGAHLGGYIRLSETDRLGVNVSQSYVSLDYEGGDYENGDGAAQDNTAGGEWELSLTGVQPYYSKQWQDGHSVWAMAGWGTGKLTLTEAGLRQASDATAWQAALGGVLPLQWGQGTTGEWARSVHVKSDLWWGRLALDGNDELLQALDSSTVGGRAMLESLHERELDSGAGLSLETGAGLRYDDGAGDAGLEWTGGLGYRSAGRRFEADIDARALLLSGDTEEWGFSAQARLTPRVDGSGWSFTLAPGWGQTNSMAEALWAGEWTSPQAGLGRPVRRAGLDPGLTVADTHRSRAVAPTLNAEIGYGIRLPWQQGLLTPYSAFTSGSSGEQIQMGLHWSLRPHLRLELDAEYQPGNGAGQEDAGLFLRYVVGR